MERAFSLATTEIVRKADTAKLRAVDPGRLWYRERGTLKKRGESKGREGAETGSGRVDQAETEETVERGVARARFEA